MVDRDRGGKLLEKEDPVHINWKLGLWAAASGAFIGIGVYHPVALAVGVPAGALGLVLTSMREREEKFRRAAKTMFQITYRFPLLIEFEEEGEGQDGKV